MTQHIEEALIGYVLRYGGMCRDCADMDGVCASGMPCDTDQRKAVVRHTLAALAYGIKHGFIANSFVDAAALAAAEERGRSRALEEAATRIDRQWRATGAMNCTEICAIVRAVAITKEPTP